MCARGAVSLQKPLKMRHMLAAYGEIGRLYLAPEDSAARRKRKKAGGNTGKNFTEGWVEFEDKGVAKYVRNLLSRMKFCASSCPSPEYRALGSNTGRDADDLVLQLP